MRMSGCFHAHTCVELGVSCPIFFILIFGTRFNSHIRPDALRVNRAAISAARLQHLALYHLHHDLLTDIL